jgi:hypothetical protein
VWVVTGLQVQPAFERLSVGDARLSLDASAPRRGLPSANLRVPGPKVAFDLERDLGSPSQRRVQPRSQALKKCELRAVADRIAGRIRAQREVEADDGEPCAELWNRYVVHEAAFEPPKSAIGGSGGGRGVAKTQPSVTASSTMLEAEPKQRLAGTQSPTVDWPLSGTHG